MTSVVTVYAVTEGEYSSYSVLALFTDQALAEAYQRQLGVADFEAAEGLPYRRLTAEQYAAEYSIEPFQLWSVVPTIGDQGDWEENRNRYANVDPATGAVHVAGEVGSAM